MIRARVPWMTCTVAVLAMLAVHAGWSEEPAAAGAVAPAEAAPAEAAPAPAGEPVPAAEPAPAAAIAAGDGEEKPERVGASTCLACHSNKEEFRGNIHAKRWPKEKKIEFEESCETCHGPGSLHAGAGGDKTHPGFKTIRGSKTLATSAGSESCLTCHGTGHRAHWAGSTHEGRNVGCATCHSVHGTNKHLLAKATQPDTCYTCHQNIRAELKRANHHPVPEGKMSCSDCHNPHGAPGPKLLEAGSINDTCFKCHTEKRGPFLHEHRPVSEDCTACHKPHGSTHAKLLRLKTPYLCQTCHSISRHPGTLYAIDPRGPGGSPFEELNTRASYRACVNCHSNIHGSNHPSGNYFLR